MAGVTAAGYSRKTLPQILDSLSANAIAAFGEELNTGDDSVFKQLAGPFSLELDEIWQQEQAAYSAYTKTGAEGLHLDNYYAFRGVGRLDSARSTDTLLVGTDEDLVDPFVLPATSFSNTLGVSYSKYTSVSLGISNTFAYRLRTEDLALNTSYSVSITDTEGTMQTVTVAVVDEASKIPALTGIRSFLVTHRPTLSPNIYFDSTGLYIGFSSPTEFNIVGSSFNLSLDPFAGTRFGKVPIRSDEIRALSGEQQDTYSINPTFTGFTEAQGSGSFFGGRNVETDAEFRLRAEGILNTTSTRSSAAIDTEVSTLTGVQDVVIYQNTTDTATAEVNLPYAIHIIVLGGASFEIASAIARQIPLNITLTGDVLVQVPDENGNNQPIRYSAATQVGLAFRFDYDTADDSLLTTAEQTLISSAVTNHVNSLQINENLSVFTLQGLVITAVGAGRLSGLTVNVREAVSGVFQTTDYITTFSEILRADTSLINFNKV